MDSEAKYLLIIIAISIILGGVVLYFNPNYNISNNEFSNRNYYEVYKGN